MHVQVIGFITLEHASAGIVVGVVDPSRTTQWGENTPEWVRHAAGKVGTDTGALLRFLQAAGAADAAGAEQLLLNHGVEEVMDIVASLVVNDRLEFDEQQLLLKCLGDPACRALDVFCDEIGETFADADRLVPGAPASAQPSNPHAEGAILSSHTPAMRRRTTMASLMPTTTAPSTCGTMATGRCADCGVSSRKLLRVQRPRTRTTSQRFRHLLTTAKKATTGGTASTSPKSDGCVTVVS